MTASGGGRGQSCGVPAARPVSGAQAWVSHAINLTRAGPQHSALSGVRFNWWENKRHKIVASGDPKGNQQGSTSRAQHHTCLLTRPLRKEGTMRAKGAPSSFSEVKISLRVAAREPLGEFCVHAKEVHLTTAFGRSNASDNAHTEDLSNGEPPSGRRAWGEQPRG